jgi:hypothetical protein
MFFLIFPNFLPFIFVTTNRCLCLFLFGRGYTDFLDFLLLKPIDLMSGIVTADVWLVAHSNINDIMKKNMIDYKHIKCGRR